MFIEHASFATTETINWYVGGNVYDTTTCNTGGDVVLPNAPTAPRGYHFAGWARYTPIEYLESTGTQWIDTGIKGNMSYTYEIDFQQNNDAGTVARYVR